MLQAGAAFLLLLAATSACSHAVSTAAVRDAQLGARVKTAIVNDATLGTSPIEVQVTGGVVRLSGRVESAAAVGHATAIAKSVAGVADVIADLRIGPAEAIVPAPAAPQAAIVDDEWGNAAPQWLAVGVSVGRSMPADGGLAQHMKAGPLVRLGSGQGLGAAFGFGWFNADWQAEASGAPAIGSIHVRPVMGGLAYGFRGDGRSLSISLLGGVAFNSLSLPEALTEQEIPLSIANSLAIRPGVSLWFDLNRRFALNLGGSYLVTRPRVRLLEDGQVRTRSLRADTVLVNTGLVYKIF